MNYSTNKTRKGGQPMKANFKSLFGALVVMSVLTPVIATAQNANIWSGGTQYVQPPAAPVYPVAPVNPQVWGNAAGAMDPYAPADLNARLSGMGYQMPMVQAQPQAAMPVQPVSPYGQPVQQQQAYPYGQVMQQPTAQLAPNGGYYGATVPYGYGQQQQIPYGYNGIAPAPYGYGAGLPYGAGGGIPYGYGNNAMPWGNNGYQNQFVPYNNIPTGGSPWFSGDQFGFW